MSIFLFFKSKLILFYNRAIYYYTRIFLTLLPHPVYIYIYIYILTASLQRGTPPPNECPRYDIKPSDGKAPDLEIWEIWSTPLLTLLPGPLRPGVVIPDVKLWLLYSNT